MFQDSITVKNRHVRFVKTVCETEIVYGLENVEGYATSSSIHYEDENEAPIGLICFWSEKALAKSCIKSGWLNYKITEVKLSKFIEDWCVGMENDGLLVGTNFDQNMFGFEAEPLELILELINELQKNGKELNFRKYNDISDLKIQVERLINL